MSSRARAAEQESTVSERWVPGWVGGRWVAGWVGERWAVGTRPGTSVLGLEERELDAAEGARAERLKDLELLELGRLEHLLKRNTWNDDDEDEIDRSIDDSRRSTNMGPPQQTWEGPTRVRDRSRRVVTTKTTRTTGGRLLVRSPRTTTDGRTEGSTRGGVAPRPRAHHT